MPDKSLLSDILKNQHFLRYASLLAISMSASWRTRHPAFPTVRESVERLAKLLGKGSEAWDRKSFIEEWTLLFAGLAMEDHHLQYTTEEATWFFEEVYGENARVTFSMLFAVASTRQTYVSAEQVHEATGMSLTTIRRKASSGEIPGARKIGERAWVFSVLALQSVGIDVQIPLIEVIEEETHE